MFVKLNHKLNPPSENKMSAAANDRHVECVLETVSTTNEHHVINSLLHPMAHEVNIDVISRIELNFVLALAQQTENREMMHANTILIFFLFGDFPFSINDKSTPDATVLMPLFDRKVEIPMSNRDYFREYYSHAWRNSRFFTLFGMPMNLELNKFNQKNALTENIFWSFRMNISIYHLNTWYSLHKQCCTCVRTFFIPISTTWLCIVEIKTSYLWPLTLLNYQIEDADGKRMIVFCYWKLELVQAENFQFYPNITKEHNKNALYLHTKKIQAFWIHSKRYDCIYAKTLENIEIIKTNSSKPAVKT